MSENTKPSCPISCGLPESYGFLLDAVAEPVILIRKEDRVIVYVNPPATRLFNKTAEEMVGRKCHKFLCPNDYGQCPVLDLGKEMDSREREILVDGESMSVVKTVRSVKDGESRYLLETLRPLNGNGASLPDERILESLDESRRRYRSLFTENQIPMMVIDPETGSILDVNRVAEEYYGYDKECFCQLHISAINQLPEEQIAEEMARARSKRCSQFVFPHRLASGEIRTVEVYSGPIPLGTKTVLYSMVHDVTEWKTTENLLAERTAELEQLFVNAPIGINLCGTDGRLLRVNRASVEMFGYASDDEVVGKTIDDVVLPPDKRAEGTAITRRVTSGLEPYSFEGTRYRKDGTPVEVSFIGVPFRMGEHAGAFAIYQDITSRRRAERDLEISNQALKKQYSALKHSWDQTIEVMAFTAELRDPYTAGHQKRVSALSKAVALEMGLSPLVVEEVEKAALVHDLGKFEIPSEILSKPGKITQLELNLIRRHAEAGYKVLRRIDLPWPLAEIVYQHHERMDGSGYPQGLKGDEILLPARIIAVADVVEAMSSHRPYRPALGIEVALGEIEKGAGTLYDPDVVATCCRIFREKGYEFPAN